MGIARVQPVREVDEPTWESEDPSSTHQQGKLCKSLLSPILGCYPQACNLCAICLTVVVVVGFAAGWTSPKMLSRAGPTAIFVVESKRCHFLTINTAHLRVMGGSFSGISSGSRLSCRSFSTLLSSMTRSFHASSRVPGRSKSSSSATRRVH